MYLSYSKFVDGGEGRGVKEFWECPKRRWWHILSHDSYHIEERKRDWEGLSCD